MMISPNTFAEVIAEAGAAAELSSPDIAGRIARVGAIAGATENTAVFAVDSAACRQAMASCAGLIFATPEAAAEFTDPRLVLVRDPRLAFALLAYDLGGQRRGHVHETAVVDTAASVAPGVGIGAGAVIGPHVQVGLGSRIGAHVVIEPGVILGARVTVQSGAVLGSYGFGYVRRPSGEYILFPQQGSLVVEDDVEIGANTTIDRGALGETRIGQGTRIDNLVHIGHNCCIGRNVLIAAQTGISGSTVVEDGAILGGQVGIGEHATVGAGVVLGGGAGVLTGKKLFGAGQVFWGRPAQPLRQYLRDLAKLRRNG